MKFFNGMFACVTLVAVAGCTSAQSQPPPDSPTVQSPVSPPSRVAPESRIAPPFDGLSTLEVVLEQIRIKEGLRLQSYRGPSGKWLIGYGHGKNVQAGMSISKARAEELLQEDVGDIEGFIKSVVSVPINMAELSAMVDLAYNIGTPSFRESTVLRKLNEGDRQGAADGFLLWTKSRQNGVLVENPQLKQRRIEERALFLRD
jgi:lysozyme